MRLRLAAAADVPALAALYAEAARTLGPLVYTPEQVAAWARFGADTPAFRAYILDARTWIAGDDPAAPEGFCGIDDAGEVHSLYVRAALVRQGRGGALLAHALADARGRGQRQFAAWATPFSRPVFERAGLRLQRVVREPFNGALFDRFRVASD